MHQVGPLFLSPLSEIYGRCIILNISNVFFCAFTLGCALAPNLGGLIAMRFFAGLGGSACLTIGTGVIADLFVASQRGKAVAMYSMGILFGPILGPICGGFIAQRVGWRWDMWVVLIVAVILTAGLFFFNRETNHVVILNRKTSSLRKELGRPELQNVMNASKPAAALMPKAILLNGITRPLKMLTTSPIVLLCSLYMSFLFGLLFLLFTTLTPIFLRTYGWEPDMTGLAYLGIGIGNFLGIGFVAKTSDATIIKLAKRNKGVYEPEMRLPLCVFFGILIPVSFFWYGWTAYYKVHWIGMSRPPSKLIFYVRILILDSPHNLACSLWLRSNGHLRAPANIHDRLLSSVRRERNRRHDVFALSFRRLAATCCPKYV